MQRHIVAALAIWLLTFCFLGQSSADAATVDVTQHGVKPTAGVDNTEAIKTVIKQSSPGDTIFFPAGTYEISGTVEFLSGRDYAGPGATLKRTTRGGFAACTKYDDGKNILITGLTFSGNGFAFNGSGHVKAENIRIVNCSIVDITQEKYPFDQGIYIPIGATHCQFVGNHFRHIRGDNGIVAWNLDHTQITDNDFDNVNECMHLNGTCQQCEVLRNRGVHIHRMGIEIQGIDDANLHVEDNHFANWDAPYYDSFGLSIVPTSGPGVVVRYNTLLGRPPVPGSWTDRFGFGIEAGGDVMCRDNLTEGYWWLGIVIGGKRTTVTHNLLRGPKGHAYCTPTKINLEPGSAKETETISENQLVETDSFIENPTDLQARTVSGGVELAWKSNSTKQTGFKVERRIADGDYSVIASLPADKTSVTDRNIKLGAQYIYRVRAFNEAGDVTYSPALLVNVGK